MPPKKGTTSSPYFKSPPVRKSTRVSNASSSSKKRQPLSSESDFEDGDSSGSEFQSTKGLTNSNKKAKLDLSSEAEESELDSSSDDESKPPRTIIIPLPKAREEGDTPYEDGRIHENTMLFLKDLKTHNNREWMRCIPPVSRTEHFSNIPHTVNDEDFRNGQKDFASFIDELSPLVTEKDFTIPELPNRDIV